MNSTYRFNLRRVKEHRKVTLKEYFNSSNRIYSKANIVLYLQELPAQIQATLVLQDISRRRVGRPALLVQKVADVTGDANGAATVNKRRSEDGIFSRHVVRFGLK